MVLTTGSCSNLACSRSWVYDDLASALWTDASSDALDYLCFIHDFLFVFLSLWMGPLVPHLISTWLLSVRNWSIDALHPIIVQIHCFVHQFLACHWDLVHTFCSTWLLQVGAQFFIKSCWWLSWGMLLLLGAPITINEATDILVNGRSGPSWVRVNAAQLVGQSNHFLLLLSVVGWFNALLVHLLPPHVVRIWSLPLLYLDTCLSDAGQTCHVLGILILNLSVFELVLVILALLGEILGVAYVQTVLVVNWLGSGAVVLSRGKLLLAVVSPRAWHALWKLLAWSITTCHYNVTNVSFLVLLPCLHWVHQCFYILLTRCIVWQQLKIIIHFEKLI